MKLCTRSGMTLNTRSLPIMACGVKVFSRSYAVIKFGVQLSKRSCPIMEFGGKSEYQIVSNGGRLCELLCYIVPSYGIW